MANGASLLDLAPRRPVVVEAVLDDPGVAWDLAMTSGPYEHVLMLPEFKAAMAQYRQGARDGGAASIGAEQGDEFMTSPIFRGNWANQQQVLVPGAEAFLHNERLVDAASQVFDAEVVRPLIVFSNLTAPMPQNRKHVDVPTFRGVERSQYPAWIVNAMAASGLFTRWQVQVATAVAWYYEGPQGGFSYWPDGPDAPKVKIDPPANYAVVGDNDFMYHRVEAVGNVDTNPQVPIDSLLSYEGDDRWHIRKDDREFGDWAAEEIRISISWKAQCFADADAARVFDEHLDDITYEQVVDTWRADCDARGVALPATDDPVGDPAFVSALSEAYSALLGTRAERKG